MGWETFFCFGVLIVVFGGLIANRAPDVLLLGAVVILGVVRIITPEEALAGKYADSRCVVCGRRC